MNLSKKELIEFLVENYEGDESELKQYDKEDLEEMLNEYEDHSDMFPNGDEFDGSHEYD